MPQRLRDGTRPAEPLPGDELVAREIELFRALRVRRVAAIEACLGRKHRPNVLRSALVREVVLAFTRRRTMHLADYQRLLRDYGSASNVRRTILALAADGLVLLEPTADAPRGLRVVASEKLMSCYREAWVRMGEEIQQHFGLAGDQPLAPYAP